MNPALFGEGRGLRKEGRGERQTAKAQAKDEEGQCEAAQYYVAAYYPGDFLSHKFP